MRYKYCVKWQKSWDVTPWLLVDMYRYFESSIAPSSKGRKLSVCFEGEGCMCLRNVSKTLHPLTPHKTLIFKTPPQNEIVFGINLRNCML
jgi:hypothetical protein